MTRPNPSHAVAVIGGATAGAEIASRLAERGIAVAVFDQNPRPYGKIEDGLPRWHVGLRHKEYATIDSKLSNPGVHFVPRTKIGEDISFDEIVHDWGFSAVVLANGAWRDRPLPIEGADAWVGKGLLYQNPFVIAFNHGEDEAYAGPHFPILDDTLIVGGGLASVDVAKIHTLTLTTLKLAERGIEVGIEELEVRGIPKVLEAHGLTWPDLGLAGATIFYRRRIEDMPVMSAPEGADEARLKKVELGRRRMLEKAMGKYMFTVEELASPDALLIEEDRVVGLVLRRTRVEGGRVIATDETFERRGAAVISSIGSIPEPIEGLPMKGELIDYSDWEFGRVEGFPTLFAAGNVVTGKGNIVASRKHAKHVSEAAVEQYLGLAHSDETVRQGVAKPESHAENVANGIVAELNAQPDADPAQIEAAFERVRQRQAEVGYTADYKTWIEHAGKPC
jgi:NADPH-dependent glutamate synthase beta subunit-like oxidoreductase